LNRRKTWKTRVREQALADTMLHGGAFARIVDPSVKYITPPNNLRKKQIDAGVQLTIYPSLVAAAATKIMALKEEYLRWVGGDLDALSAASGGGRRICC